MSCPYDESAPPPPYDRPPAYEHTAPARITKVSDAQFVRHLTPSIASVTTQRKSKPVLYSGEIGIGCHYHTITKRFSEWLKLHQTVSQHGTVKKADIQPPPKQLLQTALGMVDPLQRSAQLQEWLQRLVLVTGIFDSTTGLAQCMGLPDPMLAAAAELAEQQLRAARSHKEAARNRKEAARRDEAERQAAIQADPAWKIEKERQRQSQKEAALRRMLRASSHPPRPAMSC